MKRLSMILGAVALALTTGAVAGNSLSTRPLGASQDISELLPERRTIAYQRQLNRVEPLPNHYPLETPEGVIEVAELAWHGRYRDRYRSDAYASAPDDSELYRYDPPVFESESANTSLAAAALDAQQPSPQPAPAIAQMDETQKRYERRVVHVAQAVDRSNPTAPQSGTAAQDDPAPSETAVTVHTSAGTTTGSVSGDAVSISLN